jgi:hypothetical protein
LQTAALLGFSLRLTNGHVVYVLDDAYIHMAMAKNLAGHGVWGVTPLAFSSSSSSPLWVLILAAIDRVFGPATTAPLLLNVFSAFGLLAVSNFALRDFGLSRLETALALLAVFVFLPMAPLALSGMEHMLQAALAVGFAWQVVRQLRRPTVAGSVGLFLLAGALTAVRYEDVALAIGGSLWLLFRRRFADSVLVGAAGLVPPATYAAYAVAHGETPIPNSVLLKGNIPQGGLVGTIHMLGYTGYAQLSAQPHILVLMLGGLLALAAVRTRRNSQRDAVQTLIFLGFVATLFQLQFAQFGQFYRYEAYLVALWLVGIAGAGPAIVQEVAPRMRGASDLLLVTCALALFTLPLVVRSVEATANTPAASRNIYEQQYQMGRFLARYYAHRGVAANDIRAIDYLAEIRLLDLWGLANSDVMRARRARHYTPEDIDALARAHGTEVAVVYDEWFDPSGGLPPSWQRVGQWTIADNRVCGGPTVSFYGVTAGEARELAAHLREFASELPTTVAQRGAYKSATD